MKNHTPARFLKGDANQEERHSCALGGGDGNDVALPPTHFTSTVLSRKCYAHFPGVDKRWFWRMFPRNENRNEGTFGCSPGTKTGTRVRSHVLLGRKPERGYIRQKTTLLRNRSLSPSDFLAARNSLFFRAFFPFFCRDFGFGGARKSLFFFWGGGVFLAKEGQGGGAYQFQDFCAIFKVIPFLGRGKVGVYKVQAYPKG